MSCCLSSSSSFHTRPCRRRYRCRRRLLNPKRATSGRSVVAPPALSIARRWLSSEADKAAKPVAAAVAETAPAKEVVVVNEGGSSFMQRLGAFLVGAGLGCGVGYYHLANVSCTWLLLLVLLLDVGGFDHLRKYFLWRFLWRFLCFFYWFIISWKQNKRTQQKIDTIQYSRQGTIRNNTIQRTLVCVSSHPPLSNRGCAFCYSTTAASRWCIWGYRRLSGGSSVVRIPAKVTFFFLSRLAVWQKAP